MYLRPDRKTQLELKNRLYQFLMKENYRVSIKPLANYVNESFVRNGVEISALISQTGLRVDINIHYNSQTKSLRKNGFILINSDDKQILTNQVKLYLRKDDQFYATLDRILKISENLSSSTSSIREGVFDINNVVVNALNQV